jgi:hypothetical protein
VGLSSKVDRNSVRVLGGKGEALILEVRVLSVLRVSTLRR